jgi:hypothetical protein
MCKELSLDEWKIIGKKAKEVRKNLMELQSLLNGILPKTQYIDKWRAAEKSYGKLRSHLDDIVCGKFKSKPDSEITSIFYGEDDNK